MRHYSTLVVFLLLLGFVTPCFSQDSPKPESIMGKMAFKLTRGITNVATAIVERVLGRRAS